MKIPHLVKIPTGTLMLLDFIYHFQWIDIRLNTDRLLLNVLQFLIEA